MPYRDLQQNRDYNKKWAANNRDKRNAAARKYNWNLKLRVLAYYGKACACCGENNPKFLSIDHIDGGGNIQRRYLKTNGGSGMYQWLIKNQFPAGYQTLCFNCNMAKGFYGICPHLEEA